MQRFFHAAGKSVRVYDENGQRYSTRDLMKLEGHRIVRTKEVKDKVKVFVVGDGTSVVTLVFVSGDEYKSVVRKVLGDGTVVV